MAAEKRKAEGTTYGISSAKKVKAPYKAEYKDRKFEKQEALSAGRPIPARPGSDPNGFKLETSSAEAHAKQRALAKERKLSKPNADIIERSKKIWEQLRRKSHVSLEERKKLITELFEIVTGRARDFVFKHDSVRIIQCALKYANLEQRRLIAKELQGDIRTLAESKYGKFLVAKMIMSGDDEIRDMIIPEFYGHVRRLINHPEASWIMDDIYRQVATPEQKAIMLREWYGAEFSLFRDNAGAKSDAKASADLKTILEKSPEKRQPILHYCHELIHALVQKKMTGFTMLHDAMLQYFLVLAPGSEEQRAFLEEMLDDIDAETEGGGGDLYKNLAFTKNGSRLVCLALAHGTPKDRKNILRVFKDNIETMAYDKHAKLVLLAGLEIPDDTQMTTKAIYRELLGEKIEDKTQRLDNMLALLADINARVPILYPLLESSKSLVTVESEQQLLKEMLNIRQTTSKKASEIRSRELRQYLATPLLELVSNQNLGLTKTQGGWQFMSEALLNLQGSFRDEAKTAVAKMLAGDPTETTHPAQDPSTGRALKTLIGGGNFDKKQKKVVLVEPRLEFAAAFWQIIKDHVVAWACSPSSFAIVALLETEDAPEDMQADVKKRLKKALPRIEAAATAPVVPVTDTNKDDDAEQKDPKIVNKPIFKAGNPGANVLLKKLA